MLTPILTAIPALKQIFFRQNHEAKVVVVEINIFNEIILIHSLIQNPMLNTIRVFDNFTAINL